MRTSSLSRSDTAKQMKRAYYFVELLVRKFSKSMLVAALKRFVPKLKTN